jgi:hypothetical protein
VPLGLPLGNLCLALAVLHKCACIAKSAENQ